MPNALVSILVIFCTLGNVVRSLCLDVLYAPDQANKHIMMKDLRAFRLTRVLIILKPNENAHQIRIMKQHAEQLFLQMRIMSLTFPEKRL